MHHRSLDTLLSTASNSLGDGPIALIFAEDDAEILSTVLHHLNLGFGTLLIFADPDLEIGDQLPELVHRVDFSFEAPDAVTRAINQVNTTLTDQWIYYCYNAEFLFYPFCETRSVAELANFIEEERRFTMLNFVVDLYAGDVDQFPDAVSLETAHLDRSGYYAQARKDQLTGHPKDRQLDFHGGLRWRFEEHIPPARRKIDRIAFFRANPKATLFPDFTFSEEEMNTYACPWHHSITGTTCSFRTAKALKKNPGSTFDIQGFTWHNSAAFEWHSQQLMNLGLMEPGQWF